MHTANYSYFFPIFFEGVVTFMFFLLTMRIGVKYFKEKNPRELKLFLWYLLYFTGMLVSIINQINRELFAYQFIPMEQSLMLNHNYLVFVPIAHWFAYMFYLDFFNVKMGRKKNVWSFTLFTILVVILCEVFIHIPGFHVLGNLLIIIHGIFLYLPCLSKSFEAFSSGNECDGMDCHKARYFSFTMVCLSFMGVSLGLFFFGLRLILLNEDYNIYFYFSWLCVLLGIVFGYFSFINPKKFVYLINYKGEF